MLFTTASARAATYDVTLCDDPAMTGFVAGNANPLTFAAEPHCPPQASDPFPGLFLGVRVGGSAPAKDAAASFTVTAPANLSFAAIKFRTRFTKPDPNYDISVRTADGTLVDGCAAQVTCNEEVHTRTYRQIRGITVGLRCAVTQCGVSTLAPNAWVTVDQASATITDLEQPTVDAPAVAPGWQSTPTVNVNANDAGGIAKIALLEGATTVGSLALPCDYRHLQPCPAGGPQAVTPTLTDGVHTLTAVVTDAAGLTRTSGPATLKLDRVAPTAPVGLAVTRQADDSFVYAWQNPDQGAAAPIAAAHLSDGTVVRGANLQRLQARSGDLGVWLEDEAGNADPATAVSLAPARSAGTIAASGLQPPILTTTAPSARLKITKARRTGSALVVSGTIARGATARVLATLTRGKRAVRASAKPRNGLWTITLKLPKALTRKGTNTLTVSYDGASFAPAKIKKKLTVR